MHRYIFIILLLSSCQPGNKKAEVLAPECIRPSGIGTGTAPDCTYTLSDNHYLALWQRTYKPGAFPGQIAYSDFVLTNCSSGDIIRSVDKRIFCVIEQSKDTLIVKQLSYMALSPKLDMIYLPWLTTKYYYTENKLVTDSQFNPDVHYTAEEIHRSFEHLDTNKWKTHHELGDGRKAARMMRFASQMMIATISGSKKAAYYFQIFKEKFKPEGAYALWYKEMEDIIEYNSAIQKKKQ